MSLADLCESLRNCQQCRLASGRTQVVFGSGNPEASIMFVGEAPGFHEDKQGVPFVGAAGKLLTELLESVGLSRSPDLHCQRHQMPPSPESRPRTR